ncbi:MAG: Uma2 family endonuclease [Iamia sp.]
MRTVVLGPVPRPLAEEIERRRATGADLYDEIWEGEYHMAPAPHPIHGRLDSQLTVLLWPLAEQAGLVMTSPFNLGEPDDYRVPDRGLLRGAVDETWVPTAALVIEVVSPDDESWEKLDFYARRGVEEVVVVDPSVRSVAWMALVGGAYQPVDHSAVLAVDVDEVARRIEWPSNPGRS